ncbi:uncharacterized protein LOC126679824 isoform X1 [Mercurialis annua]|uniref:uncharacterized protein LOC126679824 isoform X1 n=1 Tax=Mercurialis annua TaxID=3986 RepID=UPI00215F1542|nr:uncharacterized protein LOC126679824 isoform X1 [Mercurialis annua]
MRAQSRSVKCFERMDMATATATLLRSPPPILAPKSSKNFNRITVRVCKCSSSGNSPPLSSITPINQNTLSIIQSSGVIACLRANSAEVAYEAASAALRGGISVLEIVVSTPCVFQILQQLVQDHPTKVLGVGTVLSLEDAINAKDAGAKFFMSPAMMKGIMEAVHDGEVLYIPGAMTPTEILSAYDAGAKIVKVYPVSALGGIRYISALNKPFAHIPMVASQGIKIDSVGDYISCGASSVVLSDAIFEKEAMAQKKFDAIYQLAELAALHGKKAVARKQNNTSN